MPLLFHMALQGGLGAGVPLLLQRSPGLRQGFCNWQLFLLLLFAGVVLTPLSTFVLCAYPQWALLYSFDPQLYPQLERNLRLLSVALYLVNFAVVLASYALTRHGICRGRIWLACLPALGAAALFAAGLLVFYPRLLFVGDFDAFWQGRAARVFLVPAGWLAALELVCVLVFTAETWRRYRRGDPRLL